MENATDLEEYMRDLLDCTLPANKKFVDELLRRCKNSVHVPVDVQVIHLVTDVQVIHLVTDVQVIHLVTDVQVIHLVTDVQVIHLVTDVQVIHLVTQSYLSICQLSYPYQACVCTECTPHWCVHDVSIPSDSPQTRKTHMHSNTETSTDKDAHTYHFI